MTNTPDPSDPVLRACAAFNRWKYLYLTACVALAIVVAPYINQWLTGDRRDPLRRWLQSPAATQPADR